MSQSDVQVERDDAPRTKFVLDRSAIDAPDKFLSELVLQSYTPGAPGDRPVE